jgi:hypothetical protein
MHQIKKSRGSRMYKNKQGKIGRIVEKVASYQIVAGCAKGKTNNMGGSGGIVVFYRRNRNDNILQIKKVIVLYDFIEFNI